MTKREKILLGILAFVAISSGGAAIAINNAVNTNGINFTRLATDVCPSGSKTCIRARLDGDLAAKVSDVTYSIVRVSPEPSPALDGQTIVYDSAYGGFKFSASAGVDGLKGAYEGASATTQNIVTATAADGTPTFRDNGGDNLVALQAQDSSGAWDFLKITNDAGTDTVRLGYGPWAGGATIRTGTIRSENTQAASGGVPIRSSPSYFFGARTWDGSASQIAGGLIAAMSSTSGASYDAALRFYCRRDTTDTLCGMFASNGTTTGLSGTNLIGTYSLAGTPTLSSNLTTTGFVGPNYGGTSTNVPSPTWTNVAGGIGFSNSWVDFGGTTAPARYMKDSTGRVWLSGTIKSGTTNTTAFTLPAGYRPDAKLYWGDASTNKEVDVSASGAVNPNMGTNVAVTLDGISFFAAN